MERIANWTTVHRYIISLRTVFKLELVRQEKMKATAKLVIFPQPHKFGGVGAGI